MDMPDLSVYSVEELRQLLALTQRELSVRVEKDTALAAIEKYAALVSSEEATAAITKAQEAKDKGKLVGKRPSKQ